ncbi:hypothetical protein B5S31_g779 [[Candida] boidinii]|nr:hypothetical protein B5S31_g779 [[Candida] boidinii]
MSEEVNELKMDQVNDDNSIEASETHIEENDTQEEEEVSKDHDIEDIESEEIDGNEDENKVSSESTENLPNDTAEDTDKPEDTEEEIQEDTIEETPEETQEVEDKKQKDEDQHETVIGQDEKITSEISHEDSITEVNLEESQDHQPEESEDNKTEGEYISDTEPQLNDEDEDIQEPQLQDEEETEFMHKTGTNPYEEDENEENEETEVNEENNNQLDFTSSEKKVSDNDLEDPVEQPSAPELALNDKLISTNTDSRPLANRRKQPTQVKSQKLQPNKIGQNSHVSNSNKGMIFGLCLVDFHHTRGPEIEYWIDDETTDENKTLKIEKISKLWPHLPFQALPDGAHLFDETFSNFTLLYDEESETCPDLPIRVSIDVDSEGNNIEETIDDELDSNHDSLTTFFGCSCIRQLPVSELKARENPDNSKPGDEYTRSIVQKSLVIISRYPVTIQLREKLSIITKSYFDQHDFDDKSVIKALYDNISATYNTGEVRLEDDDIYDYYGELIKNDIKTDNDTKPKSVRIIKESDFYNGLNLRMTVMAFKRDLMVLFKALLLEKRVLFFSKDLHKLSNIQYSLLSLIPNLILKLQDCGSPILNNLSKDIYKPTSLKISDRNSVLRFMGLPLHIFDIGGFFQPYLALQQLDYLTNRATKWYTIGSSNDLLLDQKNKLFDMVVYIDMPKNSGSTLTSSIKPSSSLSTTIGSIEILDNDLKDKLTLTPQDKRFMDFIVSHVAEFEKTEFKLSNSSSESVDKLNDNNSHSTLNYNNSSLKTYKGSDDFIRWQFEDYLIGMLSTVKYDNFLQNANETQLRSLNFSTDSVIKNEIDMFSIKFINHWKENCLNYKIFNSSSDDELFNFFEPKHLFDEESDNLFKNLFKNWRSKSNSESKNNNNNKNNNKTDTPSENTLVTPSTESINDKETIGNESSANSINSLPPSEYSGTTSSHNNFSTFANSTINNIFGGFNKRKSVNSFNSASSTTTKSTTPKKSEIEETEKDVDANSGNNESPVENNSKPETDAGSESNVSKSIVEEQDSGDATREVLLGTSTEAPEEFSEGAQTEEPPRTPALKMFDNVWSTLSGYKK